jgi:hypothetical protein
VPYPALRPKKKRLVFSSWICFVLRGVAETVDLKPIYAYLALVVILDCGGGKLFSDAEVVDT